MKETGAAHHSWSPDRGAKVQILLTKLSFPAVQAQFLETLAERSNVCKWSLMSSHLGKFYQVLFTIGMKLFLADKLF